LYADDTNVFLFDKDGRTLNSEANLCLQELGTSFKTNKLHLIWIKCVICIFSVRATDCVSLTLDGIDIQKVHTCKYLGICFDDQLTWRNHVDYEYIYNKLKQLTGIFYRLRSKLAYRWLQNIYYAFVHHYLFMVLRYMLIHMLHTWDKLVKINNKILRISKNTSGYLAL